MGFVPSHLGATADDVTTSQPGGRVFLLPGSPSRARRIAEHFQDHRVVDSARGHDVHTGFLEHDGRRVDLGCVSSGMGCPSLGIVVRELVVDLGVRRIVRVGSAGSLQERIRGGHVVVATGAVRDEGASDAYAPREVPAVPALAPTLALERAGRALLPENELHLGLVHSKDSLYGREFGDGPLAPENERYTKILAGVGVCASEMEASHLFVLGQVLGAETACVLGILGGPEIDSTAEERELAERRAVDVALRGAAEWVG